MNLKTDVEQRRRKGAKFIKNSGLEKLPSFAFTFRVKRWAASISRPVPLCVFAVYSTLSFRNLPLKNGKAPKAQTFATLQACRRMKSSRTVMALVP